MGPQEVLPRGMRGREELMGEDETMIHYGFMKQTIFLHRKSVACWQRDFDMVRKIKL
jgi:hypothetical protein